MAAYDRWLGQKFLLHVPRARGIVRRYFITNGFDGALTMLGMMAGFYTHADTDVAVALSASMGGAVALFMSGISSAYLSEAAERKKELNELEQALIKDLKQSDYGEASRFLPIIVALVNGFSPLLISLLIVSPLWWLALGYPLPWSPFVLAILIALVTIFLLGLFLGSISKTFWLWAGLRTLAIALLTIAIILLAGAGE
jgi:predicted membrane protein (TIGR00267 family)